MENIDVVKKLIGNINPVGETNTDNERFENLKEMCDLIEKLTEEVADMADRNRHSHEFSVKRSVNFAYEFMKNLSDD